MHAEVEELLRTARTENELQKLLHSLCAPCGAVERTDVLSGTDALNHMMCIVHMEDRSAADRVASRFGTSAFGNRLVVFKFEAAGDFAYS